MDAKREDVHMNFSEVSIADCRYPRKIVDRSKNEIRDPHTSVPPRAGVFLIAIVEDRSR